MTTEEKADEILNLFEFIEDYDHKNGDYETCNSFYNKKGEYMGFHNKKHQKCNCGRIEEVAERRKELIEILEK